MAAATLVGVGIAAAFAGTSLQRRTGSSSALAPSEMHALRDTGFFSLPRLAFTPQYPLWSDGARKQRWIHLPPGTSIDASDPDAWQFPIGTRLWKQFAFHGRPTETRFMLRTDRGWHYATYVWNERGTSAELAPTAGAASVALAPGVHHRIPSEPDCRACHAGGPTPVLGFSALQLSSDRDPNAPHREDPDPDSIDLRGLVARGLVRGLPPTLMFVPPRIPGAPVERAALGYLHANCGGCHRADGALATVGMELAHSLDRPSNAKRTTIAVPSQFMAPKLRVAPGDSDGSVVLARMRARTPLHQMPPLGTQLVDADATRLIARWIDQLANDRNSPRRSR